MMLRIVNVVKTSGIICGRLRLPKKCLNGSIERFSQVSNAVVSDSNHYRFRQYATAVAPAQESIDIENKLQDIDNKIRMTGRIMKSDVDRVLQNVTERGSLTPMQALLLIRCCGEFLMGESLSVRKSLCDTVWETIKMIGVTMDVAHFNALLAVLIENEIQFSPLEYLLDMKKLGIEPNRVTFQRLIDQYCIMGDIEGATKILEHMSEQELPLNENIFSSLIKGHAISGDLENATNMLKVMQQAGVEPGVTAYKALLCGYAMGGDMDNIKMLLLECKNKRIRLADVDFLDVVYYLAINNHINPIDEVLTYMTKGVAYNIDAIRIINKLIDKNCLPIAYKLMKTLKSRQYTSETGDQGRFFIKKLINNQYKAEDVIKYCNLMKEDGMNYRAFEIAIESAYINNMHTLAFQIMKAAKANHGLIVREHYFYPMFCHYRNTNNLQGIYDTLKSMVKDFKILPKIETVAMYVLPNMLDSPAMQVKKLVGCNVPHSIASNAVLLNLLDKAQTEKAAKFMVSSNTMFLAKVMEKSLVKAFKQNKEVDLLLDIMTYQFGRSSKTNRFGEMLPFDNDFQGPFLARICNVLWDKHTPILEKLLEGMVERGLPISPEVATSIKSEIGNEKIPENINSLLDKLSSGNLKPLVKISQKYAAETSTESNEFMIRQFRNSNYNVGQFGGVLNHIKFELLKLLCERGDSDKINKLVNDMQEKQVMFPRDCCEALVTYYVRSDNLQKAQDWLGELRHRDPDWKLKKTMVLRYAVKLLQTNSIDQAFDLLKQPFFDDRNDQDNFLCHELLNTFKAKKDLTNMEQCLELLRSRGFFKQIIPKMVAPFFQVELESGSTSRLVNRLMWACKNYGVTPHKTLVMKKLIEEEDGQTLQMVTDQCAKIHGENNTLVDLALAFVECGKINSRVSPLSSSRIR